ncbi:hypothetical protein phiK7A1_146 [Pseudomonas phage phiK7A1]|uniref:Uncharacterized protein n=1 Tax=Pseudomonas phage phiK7A1 TaxID=2759194 RepID=A0A7H0XFZ4_9CAUD|nr:hypothetical protein phiK7A1_146 [Pseudomonas phage phiK7A1]
MSYKLGDKVILVGSGSRDIPTGSILTAVNVCSTRGQWIGETDVTLSAINSGEGRSGTYKLELYNPQPLQPLEVVVARLKDITAELTKLQAEQQQLNATLRAAGLQLVA